MANSNPRGSVAFRLVVAVLVVFTGGCSTVVDGPSGNCKVSGVTLSPPSATLVAGSELTVGAFVAATNCPSGPTMTWTTSAATVAAVANAGTTAILSAVNPGAATITVTASGDDGTAQATMSVTVNGTPVASVSVAPQNAIVPVGESRQLTAELRDAAGHILTGRSVQWSSGATHVATISNTGVVTAHGVGTAQISATSGNTSGNASIQAITVAVASMSVAPTLSMLQIGESVQLSATTYDVNGNVLSGRPVTWSSSTPEVATVSDQGLVSAIAQGSVVITARSESASATADVGVGVGSDSDRFAWATVHGSGIPAVARMFNGKNGAVFVTRIATGRYTVSFGQMGDPLGARQQTSETVMVSPVASPNRGCGVSAWTDVDTSLQVEVHCTDLPGNFADADFNVLVVGRGSLSGSSAFVRTSTLTPQYAPDPKYSWNSADGPMLVTQSGSSRIVDLGVSSASGAGYMVTLINPAVPAFCGPNGFTTNSSLVTVRCFGPNGFEQDRLFNVLMVRGGRGTLPDARYGFAAVENPSAAQYMPPLAKARSSSGQDVVVMRLETGHWHVRFPGIAGPAGSEVVLVSLIGQPYAACFVASSASVGADFDVMVRCTDAGGLPLDHAFSLLVLE